MQNVQSGTPRRRDRSGGCGSARGVRGRRKKSPASGSGRGARGGIGAGRSNPECDVDHPERRVPECVVLSHVVEPALRDYGIHKLGVQFLQGESNAG